MTHVLQCQEISDLSASATDALADLIQSDSIQIHALFSSLNVHVTITIGIQSTIQVPNLFSVYPYTLNYYDAMCCGIFFFLKEHTKLSFLSLPVILEIHLQ